MIPLHATATRDPRQLFFVVAADYLPPPGLVRQAPDPLAQWLRRQVIEQVVIDDSGVRITLHPGHRWRDVGDAIRADLADALAVGADWQVEAADGDRLTGIVEELLAGQIGAYAHSHGGSIELVAVSGQHVTVRLSGACRGCPAAGSTLTDLLQRELRRRASDQVTVTSEDATAPTSLGRKLLTLLTR